MCALVGQFKFLLSLSSSPEGGQSSCSVFFTSLDIFSSHHTILYIPWSGYQLWVWEHNGTCEYISWINKMDKICSISIMYSPKKTAAALGVPSFSACWFWEGWKKGCGWNYVKSLNRIGNIFSSFWATWLAQYLKLVNKFLWKVPIDFYTWPWPAFFSRSTLPFTANWLGGKCNHCHGTNGFSSLSWGWKWCSWNIPNAYGGQGQSGWSTLYLVNSNTSWGRQQWWTRLKTVA